MIKQTSCSSLPLYFSTVGKSSMNEKTDSLLSRCSVSSSTFSACDDSNQQRSLCQNLNRRQRTFSDPVTLDEIEIERKVRSKTFDQLFYPTVSLQKESEDGSLNTDSMVVFNIWQLAGLTLCLAGTQFVWTVEMGYGWSFIITNENISFVGTPYLISLGLSKPILTLAWLAGPLSGLIIHPLVGTWSDRHRSRYGRRRPFLAWGVVGTIVSLYLIAYARPLMVYFGLDRPHQASASWITIFLVIVSFYLLDFAINMIQAANRSLIVDSLSSRQQSLGTSWASAMIGVGNITGYLIGSLNLVQAFPWLGTSQIQVLVTIASVTLLACSSVTVLSISEKPTLDLRKRTGYEQNKSWYAPLKDLFHVASHLPKKIRLIFCIQFFSWIGWFPFNFFSTEYVKEIMLRHDAMEGNPLEAVRAGSLALLCFSLLSVLAAILLPYLARLRHIRIGWIWSSSSLIFAALMFSTLIVSDQVAATVIVSLTGLCWAVSMWVPLSLLGEYVASARRSVEPTIREREVNRDETILLPTHHHRTQRPMEAGTLLGINNAFVVLPQLFSTVISSIVFAIAGEGPDAIVWVWQIGGLSALVAAALACKI